MRPELDEKERMVGIGLASQALSKTLAKLDFQTLDDNPQFQGRNTTAEFMAKAIFDLLGQAGRGLTAMSGILHESYIAGAGYEGNL